MAATTTHTVHIGALQYMCIDDEYDVTIHYDTNGKRAFFTGPRWARFVCEIRSIDKAVNV